MNDADPFNANPELVAMKEDVASRALRLKMIGLIAPAVAMGAMLLFPGLAPVAMIGAAVIGGLITVATFKAAKKLEIDQEFLQSRMQGKNWWGGYREEVAEQGYTAPVTPGLPDNITKSRSNTRE